ncbi:ArsR/SmtB family transcription factor [Novipirellula artificiosorum]|uniref:Putative HTH-type transcriptional regulator n=1 Tax=Novipirellula artificiosorum TaxID=2528016 RepID=A0A5C6DN01_9BACT|nr:metalloregulator ArsR/SmtB family transcription factor [Novipirellula artificiosorum]TWU38210.1 putative HTH-type transcriptional regulator [Novipirellula artificiosorum]
MNKKEFAKYEARAQIFKALAHPARLRIMDELALHQERCVCDLTAIIGSDMSTVSRHLSVLKNAGLVGVEKRGQMVFYRSTVCCLAGFSECVEKILASNAAEQRAVLN